MTQLRVIEGGQGRGGDYVRVRLDQLEELRMENLAARAERVTFTARARAIVRLVESHIAAGHAAAAGMHLASLTRLNESESRRALAMASPRCACGREGIGHGDADCDALAVPKRVAA